VEGPATELGVFDHDDRNGGMGGGEGGLRGRLGAEQPRFTLDGDDEEMGGHHHGGNGSSLGQPQPSLNVHAAQQGVLVEPLPTPQMPAPAALAPPPR
jgi:hypothetical protein